MAANILNVNVLIPLAYRNRMRRYAALNARVWATSSLSAEKKVKSVTMKAIGLPPLGTTGRVSRH